MNRPGKTPLMRAKNLEKSLGIEQIYLKLEGTNPFGSKFDRISEVLVKDALNHKNAGLFVDGSDDYINSVINFSEIYGLEVKISLFKGEKWKETLFKNKLFVDFRHNDKDNKYDLINKYCKDNNLYNATDVYANKHLSIISLQKIGEEIAEKLGDDISTVFTQLSNGYTESGIYNGFVNKWVEGEINKYPQMFSCTIPKGNAIFNDYKKNMELSDLDNYDVKINKYTRNLFSGDGLLLEDTLKAIHDTDGKIIPVDEQLLKESVQFLKKQENIILSTQDGYSFAGFYKLAKEGKIKNGKHVIILDNGKSDLDLIQITNFEEYSKDTISKWTKTWLQEYSDSVAETEEAVESAMKNGFIVLALRNKSPEGICVILNFGYKSVLPTYHIVYVGTKEGNKGRGIATELINYAIDLTDGKLSLHVDLNNKIAKNLYQKIGFKTAYYRMIYSKEL
ncbi:MAG: pyridoxal-phosphate dependent enzyme [Sedimentibacter sp.]